MRTVILSVSLWGALGLTLVPGRSPGQTGQSSREARRYEIDAKRMDSDMMSADALPRSREFKRIDSTYYVGWMFEGVYLYEHAADFRGYSLAVEPLTRALDLMEKDFSRELSTRTRDLMTYFPVYRYHLDYTLIAYYLNSCYQNLEDPQASHALLRRCLQWDFQRDYYLDAYNYLAWNTHRNRFLLSPKYPFQAETVEGNLELANRYLDTALSRVERNRRWNREIFAPGYEVYERNSVYHYKAMLHSYALHLDSARYYYDKLSEGPQFPQNNYGTFLMISGKFREAEKAYKAAVVQDSRDKRLKEWAYYSSILDIYKGNPLKGMETMKGMIRANGSTPGFGWYQIGLGRTALYAGRLDEASQALAKASGFREMHIGTTLGQEHYEFSLQLLEWIHDRARIQILKFENRNWWYNPRVLWEMGKIQLRRYLKQYMIIQRFSNNPERERVIYKLFASESTVSWDEIAQLIDGFSLPFFMNQMKKEAEENNRPLIDKYFQWVRARLFFRNGDYDTAGRILDQVLSDRESLDPEYEKLFLARVYELQARLSLKRKDSEAYREHMGEWFRTFPMGIPFSGMAMPLWFEVEGEGDPDLIRAWRKWHFQWEEGPGGLKVSLTFPSPGRLLYRWSLGAEEGEGEVRYKDPGQGARALSYSLFGMGSTEGANDGDNEVSGEEES